MYLLLLLLVVVVEPLTDWTWTGTAWGLEQWAWHTACWVLSRVRSAETHGNGTVRLSQVKGRHQRLAQANLHTATFFALRELRKLLSGPPLSLCDCVCARGQKKNNEHSTVIYWSYWPLGTNLCVVWSDKEALVHVFWAERRALCSGRDFFIRSFLVTESEIKIVKPFDFWKFLPESKV